MPKAGSTLPVVRSPARADLALPVLLEEVDREILRHLVADGRATFASLGREVGVSEPSVATRVRRMIDSGVVQIITRVEPQLLGTGLFDLLFIRSRLSAGAVARRLAELPEAAFVVATSGSFGLIVELRCRDVPHLLETVESVRALDAFDAVESCLVLEPVKRDWTRVGDVTPASKREGIKQLRQVPAGFPIDDIDRALILKLIEDGRASYAKLSIELHLSQALVRKRVLRLLRYGVIIVQAYPTPEAAGIADYMMIGMRVAGPAHPVAAAIARIPQTTLVASTVGRFDVVAEAWCKSGQELLSVLDRARDTKGVLSLESFTFLQVVKEDFSSGLAHLKLKSPSSRSATSTS
jgi:DNA-binding Lrp family transcriptional regulator